MARTALDTRAGQAPSNPNMEAPPALVLLARNPWRKRDVVERLGVSDRTVSRYMQVGLPFCKPFGANGVVCFHPVLVQMWADGYLP